MDSIVPGDDLLQQHAVTNAATEDEERARKHQRNLDNALRHALLIQQRKDVERCVLETIEALAELPADDLPAAAECRQFAVGAAVFQPGDYEDLIAERLAQRRCGYTLCSHEPRRTSTRLWNVTHDAAQYCSSRCQQKSAHVMAQLSPTPAWERGATVEIILPEQAKQAMSQRSRRAEANAELAFERGEKVSSTKPELVMSTNVVEKSVTSTSAPPELSSDSIEGYVPRSEQSDAAPKLKKPTGLTKVSSVTMTPVAPSDNDDEEQQWQDLFEHLQVRGPR